MIEINSLDTLYALIAKNTGVGFIPATLVRPEDLGRKIVCYRLKDLQARQTFVIARDPERELTAAAAEFIGVASPRRTEASPPEPSPFPPRIRKMPQNQEYNSQFCGIAVASKNASDRNRTYARGSGGHCSIH